MAKKSIRFNDGVRRKLLAQCLQHSAQHGMLLNARVKLWDAFHDLRYTMLGDGDIERGKQVEDAVLREDALLQEKLNQLKDALAKVGGAYSTVMTIPPCHDPETQPFVSAKGESEYLPRLLDNLSSTTLFPRGLYLNVLPGDPVTWFKTRFDDPDLNQYASRAQREIEYAMNGDAQTLSVSESPGMSYGYVGWTVHYRAYLAERGIPFTAISGESKTVMPRCDWRDAVGETGEAELMAMFIAARRGSGVYPQEDDQKYAAEIYKHLAQNYRNMGFLFTGPANTLVDRVKAAEQWLDKVKDDYLTARQTLWNSLKNSRSTRKFIEAHPEYADIVGGYVQTQEAA